MRSAVSDGKAAASNSMARDCPSTSDDEPVARSQVEKDPLEVQRRSQGTAVGAQEAVAHFERGLIGWRSGNDRLMRTPLVLPHTSAATGSTSIPTQARRTSRIPLQIVDDAHGPVDGDREAESLAAPAARDDRCVDPDHLAQAALTSAPPELPGLIEASVWIMPR